MQDEAIKTHYKKIKIDCIANFKSLTLGDMKNTKNQQYLAKLKTDFKEKRSQAVKKNTETIKQLSYQLLDQIVSQSIQTKQYSNMVDV